MRSKITLTKTFKGLIFLATAIDMILTFYHMATVVHRRALTLSLNPSFSTGRIIELKSELNQFSQSKGLHYIALDVVSASVGRQQ
jgi:hypothetical protein